MRPRARALAIVAAALVAACAPIPDSGAVVSLQPLTPEARSARDTALQGGPARSAAVVQAPGAPRSTMAGTSVAPDGSLRDDATYTGGPARTVAAAPALTAGSVQQAPVRSVPDRRGDNGPSVVAFALSTDNAVGEPRHARPNASSERAARGCARYASDDLAQAAFLQSGGPAVDRQGLDPDGDGFACTWDPERFRRAIR